MVAKEKPFFGCHSRGRTVIETYTGKMVDVTAVRKGMIDFRDIAHSLAYMCRYGGHSRRFYSVAAHCIHCHDEAIRLGRGGYVLAAVLLHDAAEAYWNDLARPLKVAPGMERYNCYLDDAQSAIEHAAGPLVHRAAVDCRSEIKRIDNAVLLAEARRLIPSGGRDWVFVDGIEAADISRWNWWWYNLPGRAEAGFLKRLRICGII